MPTVDAASRRVGERPTASFCSGKATRRDAASTVARFKNNAPLSTSTSTSTFFKTRPPLSTYFLHLFSILVLSLSALAEPVATSAISAKAYVQDGLVGHWDGVENAGYGLHGDIATDGWTDLASGCVLMPNISSGGSVTTLENGVKTTKASLRAYDTGGATTKVGNGFLGQERTVEIAGYDATYTGQIRLSLQTAASDGYRKFLWYDEYSVIYRTIYNGSSYAANTFGVVSKINYTIAAVFNTPTDCTRYFNAVDKGTTTFGSGSAQTISTAYLALNALSYSGSPYSGSTELHGLRVYNRALSAAEILQNRSFDRMRYESATSADTGYAFIDGQVKIRFAAKGLYGAEVSMDGGEWTTSVEKWCPTGTIATVRVRVPEIAALKWLECPADAGKSEDGLTVTFTSSVPATVSVRAGDVLTWNSNDGITAYWDDASKWTCSDGVTHRVPEAYDDAIINDRTSGSWNNNSIYVTNSPPRLGKVYLGAQRWLVMKNWDTKFSAREIVLYGWSDSTYGYHDNASSRFTCSGGFSDTTMSNRVWIVAENLVLSNAYAYINCNGAGYAKQNGPAWKIGSKWNGACAPHGGPSSTGGGTLYGSIKEPTEPGSGPYSTSSYAYSGGGAVRVEATNIVVNGSICTTGNSSSYGWGGGSSSGGSVYISCRTISGTGSVTANGGGNTSSSGSGAGGGGRVAVHYDPVAQSNVICNLAFAARGGTDQNGDTVRYAAVGGSGSVYFPDRQMLDRPGRHVAGWVYTGPDVTLVNSLVGENLALTNSLVELGAGGRVDVKGDLSFYGTNTRVNGLRTSGGRVPVSVGGDLTLTGARLNVDGGGSVVVGGKLVMSDCTKATVSGEVRIRAAPTNGVDQAYGATLDIGGRWLMGKYAAYYPVCDSTNGSIVAATADALIMDSTALMNANSAGYRCCYGPGRSNSASGHGGKGGNGCGSIYGNAKWPLRPGSGNNNATYGLSGGGVIYVTTRGKMALGGTISAKGGNSSATNYGAGPGSGGSILLKCGAAMSGPVTISAAGGSANGSGYGSGGGRVAIYHHAPRPGTNVVVTANGGTCSSSSTSNETWGCSGTVYWRRQGGTCIILK